ncbi:MAG TPA: sigma-70 family RNA polymerase sigma factor [Candidatus Limnocylindrales bacterium]|nr:sigma-70 family RNA polymerase sigma factor [Candidatus Limnocylindrales bacterium]
MADRIQTDFEALLESHRGIVFKTVNTYCWRPEDRDDLAQEISTQLWKAWPKYDASRPFSTWMYRIALNVAISFVRREVQHRKVFTPLEEELHDTSAQSSVDHDATAGMERLRRFIAAEPPFERALLLLYLEDKPQKEIAEILGITPTNVSTKISRLKQRIRTEI